MGIKQKTTKSSRRHAYSSFRERIEAIKIEPALKLTKRAHDYVETSHLLATFEHWKEVNISGDFTEFGSEIESYVQTLPQILYHQKEIFQALTKHIRNNDAHSIQPLMEMLAQFVHDLGPDFLPYYQETLDLLIALTLDRNVTHSETLEATFTCMAFIFKYLSRHLATDLLPTFITLKPLLKLTTREYISRFCSEALSFLIRKTNQQSLVAIIAESLNNEKALLDSNYHYCNALSIMFSEAMKNTQGTFHTRSLIIVEQLLHNCLMVDNNAKTLSVISDVLLKVFNHGTPESLKGFLEVTLGSITEILTASETSLASLTNSDSPANTVVCERLIAVSQIITTLIFAESGKKIEDWSPLLAVTDQLFAHTQSLTPSSEPSYADLYYTLLDSVSFLAAVLIRNCELKDLTKYHVTLFRHMYGLNDGHNFLPFLEVALNLSTEKTLSFAAKYLQDFVSSKWAHPGFDEKIALFLTNLAEKDLLAKTPTPGKLSVVISHKFHETVLTYFVGLRIDPSSTHDLQQVYWRLLILRHTSGVREAAPLLRILTQISTGAATRLGHDLCGMILESLAVQDLSDEVYRTILANIIENFNGFKLSTPYVTGVLRFVSALSHENSRAFLVDNFSVFVQSIASNVYLPHHDARYVALQLLIATLEKAGRDVPSLISQCRLIEEIPLTLQTGRDIILRVRNLGMDFAKEASADALVTEVVTRFMFGLLSNKFAPCWEAVYEALPSLVSKATEQLWELAYELIARNYRQSATLDAELAESEAGVVLNTRLDKWLPSDYRLRDTFKYNNRYFAHLMHPQASFIVYADSKRAEVDFTEFMRGQAIKALATVKVVAEKHSQLLVPFLLNDEDEDEDEDEEEDEEENEEEDEDEKKETTPQTSTSSRLWSVKDRNAVVSLFAKFNNLRKVHRSAEVYQYLLRLLGNRNSVVQKIALECLLNFKNQQVNRYKNNLECLLEESTFRDEIAKFLTTSETSTINSQDLDHLMPLVIRILFGRAQTAKTGGNKTGRKFAVVSVLPNIQDKYIVDFLKLGSDRIDHEKYFGALRSPGETYDLPLGSLSTRSPDISEKALRRLSGFVNLLTDVYSTLGLNYPQVLCSTVEPLLYALCVSQYAVDHRTDLPDPTLEKAARNIRQFGMRNLSELFTLLGANFDWSLYIPLIYSQIVSPRFENFAEENLQQPSALMKMITGWASAEAHFSFLYHEDFAAARALLSLLPNAHAKDSVILTIMEFATSITAQSLDDERFIHLVALVVESCLATLPAIFTRVASRELNARAIALLLALIDRGYISDNTTKKALIDALCLAMDKPNQHVDMRDKVSILKALAALVGDFDCSLVEVTPLYESCSKAFKVYSDRNIRKTLISVFESMGGRFSELERVGELISNLNAYSAKYLDQPDFEKRLAAYKTINDAQYPLFSPMEWLPLLYSALFQINDDEFGIRTNATYLLNRFVDAFSQRDSPEEAAPFVQLFKNVVLPHLRLGLRKEKETTQTEFISVLAHIVEHAKYYTELDDMKVLLFGGDEEVNFFYNINHIQLHRRQRAVRRVRDVRNELCDNSVSHYLLPLIEHYAFCKDDKLRNLANDSIETIGALARCVSWNQYKALLRRYISYVRSKPEQLRDVVGLVVAVSGALLASTKARAVAEPEDEVDAEIADVDMAGAAKADITDIIRKMPSNPADIIVYITGELFPKLTKVLTLRDDETIVHRIPLSEALTSLVMCLPEEQILLELPGILTSVCQIMRSRSEELRDAVRKNLGRMAKLLGAQYIQFILKELKGALTRGSQIHVLSFTIHALLVSMKDELSHGDLDESAVLIVNVIMEDVFGAAGQEKDADGYTSKMKEVKHNKSFDTGELLAANISLKTFNKLITPVKLLLRERIQLKTQNKLEELLRRYALGLNHNDEASSRDLLVLCYELHKQSVEILGNPENDGKTEAADHFLVKLSSRPLKTQMEYSLYVYTLQKFAFDLLRTAITRHQTLMTTESLLGFVPLLEDSLHAENEGVMVSCLKALNLIVRLPFAEETDAVFKTCARRTLTIIKDTPNTNSELSQMCLRFLATVIRHKEDIKLKDTAVSYILVRIQPDLEEPNRQGLAFNFLKSVVSKLIPVPEVYDTMDKVSQIMVTNHAKEIRDMARSVYFQFLMTYDQGRGRIEKQFKFLISNLEYPAQAGRQSVMELVNLVLNKASSELLQRIALSFFVPLANVFVADDAHKCREMALVLITTILKKLKDVPNSREAVEKYLLAWIQQEDNELLSICGLKVYKTYASEVGLGVNSALDAAALKRITRTLDLAKNNEEEEAEVEWESVHASLTVFGAIAGQLGESAFVEELRPIWDNVTDSLLYPHSWVRSVACRLTGMLLSRLGSLAAGFGYTDYDVQTIATRLLRQLSAPSIETQLGTQIVKNLVAITMFWTKNSTLYQSRAMAPSHKPVIGTVEEEPKYKYATDWIGTRISAIMRNEANNHAMFVSKKSAIQFSAMMCQVLPLDRLTDVAQNLILALYNFTEMETATDAEKELGDLALECLQLMESKLGVSDYTRLYTTVRQQVTKRRQDRRAKKAHLAITAPDVAAKRKMKKHERFREKRKHEKDDNGYYHSKKKRMV
ncbi:hypothetical protein BABINDRAFT_160250 [Babjeviella inositovora NRRL Y-12698]|uniref:Uncharacterized protein n=1 Tax=Babjeviella inositovora NRRL Y-12698 TaxID=984486 RepID=A0A1E3QWI9_9ASCO|nr:uncharacterized protein BABINDRAFT_160250 [Babjeviella inositovora NRRL Y-12698]ODQ82045.1 hypothetical protein BABINDRAFT_160250 [Babjeviella inositovora NRRL Y-12698]